MASLPIPLVLSCLLHAGLVFSPMLGERGPHEQAAFLSPHSAPAVFTATLGVSWREKFPTSSPPAKSGLEVDEVRQSGTAESKSHQSRERTEGAGLLPIPGPVYFTTDQLTKRPQAIAVEELDTEATRSIVASGTMILRLRINDRGEVVDADIEENGLPEIFAATAVNAFKHSRFTPGERDGVRVNTMMRIEVRFDDQRLSGR